MTETLKQDKIGPDIGGTLPEIQMAYKKPLSEIIGPESSPNIGRPLPPLHKALKVRMAEILRENKS